MFQIKKILLLSLSLQSIFLLVIAQANIKKPFIEHLFNSPRIDKIQDESAIASIRLYNPTQSEESSVVEIPVGNIATPGLVDWQNTRLVYKGKDIPFSIREGQAHWRAALIAPIKKPRAEDLLVFQISVPPMQWAEVELFTGVSKPRTALTRRDGYEVITYPNMKVIINERTGLLTNLEAYGESLLSHPLGLRFFKVGEEVVNYEGRMEASVGFQHPPVMKLLKSGGLGSPMVKLVSWSSTEALTELNFVVHFKKAPAIVLTYRIYPNNQIEILSDERPWQGTSPWLDYGLEYKLALAGRQEELPDFQTHFPMYGYKDYAASVNSVGTLYHGTKTRMFELGEESINGRFWRRLVAIYPETERVQKEDPLTLLDEGLIVTVSPMLSQRLPKKLSVVYAEEIRATGDLLVDSLKKAGIEATTASEPDNNSGSTLLLNLVKDPAALEISGDGFRIQALQGKNGIEVVAGMKFGLFRGISCFEKFNMTRDSMTVPLIAQNPVVDLRGGGFGGGNLEVDFPYGNNTEWEHAFSGMITSGMNVMTDLGMWSDWQMPVYFKYMPELGSDSPNEYDPVSGVNFSQISSRREQGLKLLNFLHARGVKVWLWIPIGAIPTTFEKKFPEATVPGNGKVPRFMAPEYRLYLEAYFKELLEVYPVDGFVLIRDDNGGIDTTEEFKKYVAESKTKNPVWEQYLVVYKLLRSMSFKGQIAVYPYADLYEPKLDSLLQQDLLIVGHGSGMGVLTRNFKTVGTMGDTWLDNLYAAFRVPTSGRMKRLLADRGSYWIGGAYRGAELLWEAVGYFGWQPSASVNTFRYDFGARTFGKENAVDFVTFSDAYEHLWKIMDIWLLPHLWVSLGDCERAEIAQEGRRWLTAYYQRLNRLEEGAGQEAHKEWFAQVGLYGSYFNYHLRRLELLSKMEAITDSNKQILETGQSLSEPLRNKLIAMNDEIYALAYGYDQQVAQVPGQMLVSLRANKLTLPFKEYVFGYDGSLDNVLAVKQFDSRLRVLPVKLIPGQPFELKMELQNVGCMPWISGVGQNIVLDGDTARFGLPARWDYEGEPMVFGDRRIITLRGVAPEQHGTAKIKINFISPGRSKSAFFSQTVELKEP